jgi:hypothetical protein
LWPDVVEAVVEMAGLQARLQPQAQVQALQAVAKARHQ